MFTREKILEEIKKIQYLYGLKEEIRYGLARKEDLTSESVAEHVYGMSVIARYFLPLEDPEGKWNREKIYDMIVWHDIDEIEAGDKIGYRKTEADRAREKIAMQKVLASLPDALKPRVTVLIEEYEAQETPEARFVKAIDRMEPNFQLFNENGRRIQQYQGATLDDHSRIKLKYVEAFPYMKAFNEVCTEEMEKSGHFTIEKDRMVH